MSTQYDDAIADARRAYEVRWTAGQRREASFDFGQYQASVERASWPVGLARYRYDYEFPDTGEEAGQ